MPVVALSDTAIAEDALSLTREAEIQAVDTQAAAALQEDEDHVTGDKASLDGTADDEMLGTQATEEHYIQHAA
eukprot:11763958-Karenia_brevis.AAC.1